MTWTRITDPLHMDQAKDDSGNTVWIERKSYAPRIRCGIAGRVFELQAELTDGSVGAGDLTVDGQSIQVVFPEGFQGEISKEDRIHICQVTIDGLVALGVKASGVVEGPTKLHMTWLRPT